MDADAKKAIQDRWDAYLGIASSGDVEGWASYWTSDARILEPGMDFSGKELFDFGRNFFEGGGKIFSLDLEPFETHVHGDTAYQIGQYDESFQAPGQDRQSVQNYFFAMWKKQDDGGWRIGRFMAGPRAAPEEG